MDRSRSVRIFLSSTFRDFGAERELLVRKVFPALRARLKERFVELMGVDLRWGITVEEAEGKHAAEGRLSVLSILHYFDSRIHLAREHGFFYAKSLDILCIMPYFVLTDDMKLHLWKVSSTSFACERPVLRCLANCWATDDTLLPWCSDERKRWGVKQEPFDEFVARFFDDWDVQSVKAAQSAIRRV
jgi:hypothetical protein